MGKSKKAGRIVYIEPNNVIDNNTISRDGTRIPHPYEDYCIGVDLEVFVADRYSCGLGEGTNFGFSSEKGTLSFMGGKDKVLTTQYTDINMNNPADNSKECLGIESINITYNSWMYPNVVIKFTDVRGASLFLPQEQKYYNNPSAINNDINASNFYVSLFTFPYPLFKLKVKGFYGNPITYNLSVEDVQAEFDASKGSFNVTVKFIGYMYGIYTDIPLSYISLAPYIEDDGVKYWKNQTDNGVFKYLDGDNAIGDPMKTFPEFRYKLSTYSADSDKIISQSEESSKLTAFNNKKNAINLILSHFPLKEWKINPNKGIYYHINTSNNYLKPYEEEWKKSVNDFFNNIDNFNKTYPNTALNSIDISVREDFLNLPKKDYMCKISRNDKGIYDVKETYFKSETKENNRLKEVYERYTYLSDFLKINNLHVDYYIYEISFDVNFVNKINKIIESFNAEENQLNDAIIKAKNQAINRLIGFNPTIKNIFNMTFAHMETFIHVFYNHLSNIKQQLDSQSDFRDPSHYNININNTDVRSYKYLNSKYINRLPPFATFYEEKNINNSGNNNSCVREEKWPGDLPNGNDLEEVKLVYKILNAVKTYKSTSNRYDEIIKFMSINNSHSTDIVEFIPITPFDLINKENMINPYKNILDKVSDSSINEYIIYIFVLRLYTFISYFGDDYKNLNRALNMFAQVEAQNMVNAFDSSNITNSFISNFLKSTGKTVSCVYDSNSYGWSLDGIGNIFRDNNGKIEYNWVRNDSNELYLPIGRYKIASIKSDWEQNFKDVESIYLNISNINSNNYDCIILDDAKFISDISSNIHGVISEYNENVCEIYKEVFSKKKINISGDGNDKTVLSIFNKKNEYSVEIDDYLQLINMYYYKSILPISIPNNGYYGDKKFIFGQYKTHDFINYNLINDVSVLVEYPSIYNIDEMGDRGVYSEVFKGNIYNLFGCNEYYKLNKISDDNLRCKAKGLMFLLCVPLNLSSIVKYGKLKGSNIYFKAHVLKEGAIYWYQSLSTDDKLIINGVFNESLFNEPWNKFEYGDKKPSSVRKEKFIEYFKNWCNFEFQTIINCMELEIDYKPVLDNDKIFTSYEALKNANFSELNRLVYDLNFETNIHIYVYNKKISDLKIERRENSVIFDLNKILLSLYLHEVTVIDTTAMYNQNNVKKSDVEKCYGTFLKICKERFKAYIDAADEGMLPTNVINEDLFKDNDLRLSVYNVLKNLYNRWFCASRKDKWSLSHPKSEFKQFKYIDSFYHDIGNNLLVNATHVSELVASSIPTARVNLDITGAIYEGMGLYEFLSLICQQNQMVLMALPVYFGMDSKQNNGMTIEDMFDAKPYLGTNMDDYDTSTFISIYPYKPSEYLDISDDSGVMSYVNDGFDIADTWGNIVDQIPSSLNDINDNNYLIPAFGVTYAKQNQSYFTSVKVNMGNAMVTEYSIGATLNIASNMEVLGKRQSTLYGQDLYRIYSNYSYTCEVEALGNAQILPMMYFQLNNIPMFKGAYTITKVEHNISAGTMKTNFTGVRLNKNAIPLRSGTAMFLRDINDNNLFVEYSILANEADEISLLGKTKTSFIMVNYLYEVYYDSKGDENKTLCEKFAPHLEVYMKEYNITKAYQIAMFVAQIGIESGRLKYTCEIGNDEYFTKYNSRKGLHGDNMQENDGIRYKGRGLIQLTGRLNYEKIDKDLKTNFINNPVELEEPKNAARSACWYWNSRNLNNVASDIVQCTFKINGGYNHLKERNILYEKALKTIRDYYNIS